MDQLSSDVLLVGLFGRVKLCSVVDLPTAILSLDGVDYYDEKHGEFTGFYDWLRVTSDQVIGVRYWPFDEINFRYDSLCRLSYVFVPEGKGFVEIYFSNDRAFDPLISADQDFGRNKIYASASGDYVITFDTSRLTKGA